MTRFSRNKVIAFDFDEALAFEGDTGPYLQYAAVRAANIFRKLEETGLTGRLEAAEIDALSALPASALDDGLWDVVRTCSRTLDTLEKVAEIARGLAPRPARARGRRRVSPPLPHASHRPGEGRDDAGAPGAPPCRSSPSTSRTSSASSVSRYPEGCERGGCGRRLPKPRRRCARRRPGVRRKTRLGGVQRGRRRRRAERSRVDRRRFRRRARRPPDGRARRPSRGRSPRDPRPRRPVRRALQLAHRGRLRAKRRRRPRAALPRHRGVPGTAAARPARALVRRLARRACISTGCTGSGSSISCR